MITLCGRGAEGVEGCEGVLEGARLGCDVGGLRVVGVATLSAAINCSVYEVPNANYNTLHNKIIITIQLLAHTIILKTSNASPWLICQQ